MESIETTDRYQALGRLYPVPWTMCKGSCEGLGAYPMRYEEWLTSMYPVFPQQSEPGVWEKFPPPDGYVWVQCPSCHGNGYRTNRYLTAILGTIYGYYYPLSWLWMRVKIRFENETKWDAAKHIPFIVRMTWNDYRTHRKLWRHLLRGKRTKTFSEENK